jgi:hypothetical protein
MNFFIGLLIRYLPGKGILLIMVPDFFSASERAALEVMPTWPKFRTVSIARDCQDSFNKGENKA